MRATARRERALIKRTPFKNVSALHDARGPQFQPSATHVYSASVFDLRLVVTLAKEVELGVVAGLDLVGPQEATKVGRALEEALALARAW